MYTGHYSPVFKKLNGEVVIDSLFVEPIDKIFDSYDEQNRKTFLQKHTDEAHSLFQNLALDPKLVHDLNQKFCVRNLCIHSMDKNLKGCEICAG